MKKKNYLYKKVRAELGLDPGSTYAETDPDSLKDKSLVKMDEKLTEESVPDERTN